MIIPKRLRGRWRRSGGNNKTWQSFHLLVVGLLALACTVAIHVVYEILSGPDPARYGFRANFGMEFGLVASHVRLIAAGIRLLERTRADQEETLRAPKSH
jgi:hypothetical protein